MNYRFSGSLEVQFGVGLERPLAGVTVRLYRARDDGETTRAVAARPKESFRVLPGPTREGLLGEAETGDAGRFDLSLDESIDYDGGPVRMDVLVEQVAGERAEEPVQATLATVQPRWGKGETGAVTTQDHRLGEKEWCALLEELGIWVVLGRVTDADSGDPLRNLTVTVHDADIVQDDDLGSATTGTDGGYAVYYTVADFESVPGWWSPGPVELTPGPDLYVTVTNADGDVLLDEDRDRGRDPGRENVGPCATVNLELDLTPGPGDPALFTHVGPFSVAADVESDGTIVQSREGLGGAGWGFTGQLDLGGFVPQTDPDTGEAMWYRFLYRTDGAERPVVGSLLGRVTVGHRFDGYDAMGFPVVTPIVVAGSGGGPGTDPGDPDVYVPTSGSADDAENGWIPVIQTGQPGLLGDGYGPELLRFDTTDSQVVPGGTPSPATPGTPPGTSETGDAVTIVFETTVDDGAGAPSTDPADVERRGETTVYVNNWREVRELAVVDDADNEIGCSVTDTATVQYTVDHEFLTQYGVGLTSPAAGGGSAWPDSLLAGTVDRDATPHGTSTGVAGEIDLGTTYDGSGSFDAFADWPSCSYIARLSSRLALTDGRTDDVTNRTAPVDGVFYKQ
jgi:hypothetical protein